MKTPIPNNGVVREYLKPNQQPPVQKDKQRSKQSDCPIKVAAFHFKNIPFQSYLNMNLKNNRSGMILKSLVS
jgi:hypothetical protein